MLPRNPNAWTFFDLVEVWRNTVAGGAWISNYIPQNSMHMITYAYPNIE